MTVEFIYSARATGVRNIDVNGRTGAFAVRPFGPAGETSRINWWLVGDRIALVIAGASIIALTVRRLVM
jgi:hypothetical protein